MEAAVGAAAASAAPVAVEAEASAVLAVEEILAAAALAVVGSVRLSAPHELESMHRFRNA